MRPRTLPAAALAAVAGMLTAGLFEYNFGDSEFLMLFLLLVTVPFAAARSDADAHA
jgi:1,4-dihydroxy-2-naphthoate octaprenyltransferase